MVKRRQREKNVEYKQPVAVKAEEKFDGATTIDAIIADVVSAGFGLKPVSLVVEKSQKRLPKTRAGDGCGFDASYSDEDDALPLSRKGGENSSKNVAKKLKTVKCDENSSKTLSQKGKKLKKVRRLSDEKIVRPTSREQNDFDSSKNFDADGKVGERNAFRLEEFDEKTPPEGEIARNGSSSVVNSASENFWLPLAELAIGKSSVRKALASSKFVGAHVSISGGLDNAPRAAAELGCLSFGLFLRCSRRWDGPALNPKVAEKFKENCRKYNFAAKHIVPHGSYLLNAGSPNKETLQKTRNVLLDEVKRCEMLGLTLYNFHPGSTCGLMSVADCVKVIAETINFVHEQTKDVVLVLETMATQGNTVGSFDELKSVIDHVIDKSRVGVCIDSCHVFAAGYDVSNKMEYENMMKEFETKIGLPYLKAIHLNDSSGTCGCRLDRHQNIGQGKIGAKGFTNFMNDSRLNDIPLILETPVGISDTEEIVLLYDLVYSNNLSS